ncbi:hypothetical protein SPHINGOT1_100025 [Sphingomonas sp. T1]|nr:hypothetical protein SPHINGOT1_100025 [Sphingomonas sp. T1]
MITSSTSNPWIRVSLLRTDGSNVRKMHIFADGVTRMCVIIRTDETDSILAGDDRVGGADGVRRARCDRLGGRLRLWPADGGGCDRRGPAAGDATDAQQPAAA